MYSQLPSSDTALALISARACGTSSTLRYARFTIRLSIGVRLAPHLLVHRAPGGSGQEIVTGPRRPRQAQAALISASSRLTWVIVGKSPGIFIGYAVINLIGVVIRALNIKPGDRPDGPLSPRSFVR